MNRTVNILGLLILCLVGPFGSGFAQTTYLNDVGSPAYSVQIPIENGFIDVSNGDLHMEFSLATHPQRGALKLNERLIYDSRIWTVGCYSNCYYWPSNIPNVPLTQGGWRFVTGAETGTISSQNISSNTTDCDYGQDSTGTANITWTDPTGTSHTFNATIFWEDNTCDGNSSYTQSINGGYATDGSGYNVVDDRSGNPLVLDSQGTEVYPQVIDRYGNYWSFDSNGNLIDDTGRVPVIVTQNGNVTYYDVLSPNGPISNNGMRVRYTVTTGPIQINTDFNSPYATGAQDWSGTLSPIQSIQLPDGSSYTFAYDSVQRFQSVGYGELTGVTLPTGGNISYDWATYLDVYNNTNRWMWKRTVGSNPPTIFTPGVLTFCSSGGTGCEEKVNVHRPSGDETEYVLTINNGAWNTAVNTYTGSAASGTMALQTTNSYDFSNQCPPDTCTGSAYVTKSLEATLLPSSGLVSYTQPAYANPMTGQLTSVKEWDYIPQGNAPAPGNAPSSTPNRETDYSYTGLDVHQVTVLSGGNQAGQTTYGYSPTAGATTSGVAQHGSSTGPYLHTVSHWNNLNPGSPSTTTYTMDDTGEIINVVDPNQNPASTISYQCANSLPNQMTNPLGQTTTYGYDCNSGAPTSLQDPNDSLARRQGTIYQYDAVAGRLQSVFYPDGGGVGYSYPSPTEMDTTVTSSPDPSVITASILDSMGRPYQTVTNGVSSETTYDANGRGYCITNPHLTTASATDGSTCITAYDGLDRPLMQTQPDGSTVQWSYSANTVTTRDESGNSWLRTSNVFGQLTSVVEPGNLLTSYLYDGLGNLSNVTQNGASGETPRTRSFTYDSLSRLTWSSIPESGLTHNQYDSNGNISSRTDARGIVTTYSYDPLNRLTSKQYSDGTPSACFQYDASSLNGIGRLTSEWTQAGACPGSGGPPSTALTKRIITQYDPVGRETVEQQCPWGGCSDTNAPTLQYGFDLAGNRTSFTDVVNTTLGSSYDASGRLNTLASSLWDGNHPQLVFAVDSYGPMGLSNSRLGNGYYELRSYTNRGWLQSYKASKASDTQTATAIYGFVDVVRNHQDGGMLCRKMALSM